MKSDNDNVVQTFNHCQKYKRHLNSSNSTPVHGGEISKAVVVASFFFSNKKLGKKLPSVATDNRLVQ